MNKKRKTETPEDKIEMFEEPAQYDPPEPGSQDAALNPPRPTRLHRGFTTLRMAMAFRESLCEPRRYCLVELREGGFAEGTVLGYFLQEREDGAA